ncbi:MAG TPA: SRPBCC family protein [Chitinophagaceae bacterium]|nr:SRPBCC family protein [Chitinophagaceae bacterium]
MRIIKLGIISIIVFFMLFTIIGSLFPSDILVIRSTDINRPVDSVSAYVNDFSKWNDWMEGAKTGELKVFAKDSTHAVFGNTIMTLTNKTDSSWRYEWSQGGSTQSSSITIVPVGGGCKVQWEYQQHLPWYPWAKLASVMNDKIIGTAIEENLANLKKAAEH